MRTVFIYALCEPGTRTVRYIGQTRRIEKRFREHVKISSKEKTHLGYWLRGIAARGEAPNMVILREVSEIEGDAAEIKYIRIARESLGMELVNSTEGGEGATMNGETRTKISVTLTGLRRSQEFCAAISARQNSPEWKAEKSAAMTGKNNPMFGKPCSERRRANIGAANKGRRRSIESREKQSQTLTGSALSDEHCAAISAGLRAMWARRKANS